jgi:hypothetical protein
VPVSGKTIQFTVGGTPVGTAVTNASGIASLLYTITQNSNTYTILAEFLQDDVYASSSNTNNLAVDHTPTAMVVNTATGHLGDKVDLIAKLTDTHSNVPVSGKIIQFTVDGTQVGQAVTNASGIASYVYTIIQSDGTYSILAEFLQDDVYASSSNTNNLGVNRISTSTTVNNISGFKGDTVHLTATLTDVINNVPIAGKIIKFSLNGSPVGTAVTNASGIASLAYTIVQNSNTYTILAEFIQDNLYASSSNTNNLKVDLIPTALTVNPLIGYKGKIVYLVANLKDTHSNVPLSGKTIQFTVGGTPFGTALTNASGIATLAYTITQNSGTYQILAKLLQDATYTACTNTNKCVVDNIAPTASASPTGNYYNTAKIVYIKSSESGTIYYTLNGTSPTTSSTKYSAPLSITSTKILKYLVVDLAGNKSPIYTQTYIIDKIAPKVTVISPASGASGVSLTSTIYIRFSENIVAGTNFAKIYVKNLTTGKIIAISKTISGSLLSIKTSTRTHKCLYQVYIPAGAIKDKAGNILKTVYTFKFRTG